MKKLFVLLAFSVLALNCQNKQSKVEQEPPVPTTQPATSVPTPNLDPRTFSGNMQELQETLTRLLPLAVDVEQYNAPQNKKRIEKDVKRLLVLSKNVIHSPAATLKDPSIVFISRAFQDDIERIDESLALGKRDFARHSLMNLTAYCIDCHTRTATGPSFRSPALEQSLKKLKPLEKGEFLLATRQFDAALQEFSKVIDAKLKEGSDFADLEKAVRYSLAVTVKYLKDPARSLAVIEKIKKARKAPYYLKQNAAGWETAIRDWAKEPEPENNSVPAVLKRVREWISKGQQMQVGMVDRGGDIYFLRALSDLHLILVSQLTPDQLGEALFLTGLSYEATKDLGISNLHENYYESCIRRVPQSSWAKKCFKRYQESVYFGYTGSSGVRLPEDVAKKMDRLKSLAFQPGEDN